MKAFFTHPITITVGIIITLGALALVGYNYWGWFGGKDKAQNGAPQEGDKCHIPNILDAVTDYVGGLPLDGIIKDGKCVGRDGDVCAYASEPAYIKGVWKDGKCIIAPSNSSVSENETSRMASTIPVNKNWNYSKVDVWQKNQQGDTIKLSGSAIPSMFQKGVLVAVNMQSANGNQTIALNQHILDINNSQGWMIVSLYNSKMAPQWVGGYVQKV